MPNLNVIKEGPGGFNEYIDDRAEAVVNAALVGQRNVTLNQVAAPTSGGLAASTGTAGNITGSTSYQVTFVTASGETELSPISTIAGPVAGQIQLTAIPTGPTGVVARKLYRTNPAQGPEPRFLTTINDNTTTTYLDNAAAASVTELPLNINTTGGLIYNDDVIVFAADKAVTIVGYGSGATNATANNVFIGKFVAPNQGIGYWNTGVGDYSLNAIDDGYEDTAVGVHALGSCISGKYNTAVGVNAGRYGTAGSDNCFFGYASGLQTQGTSNCFYGVYSGQEIANSESVCAFGIRAGAYLADGVTAHTQSSASLYVGADTKSGANGSSYEIVIGATVAGLGSSTVTIGRQDNIVTRLHGILQLRKPASEALTEAVRIFPDGTSASRGNFYAVNFMGQGVASDVVDFCSRISSGFDSDAARMTIGTNVGGVMQNTLTLKNNCVGVRNTNPGNPLDVTGNAVVSGTMTSGSFSFTGRIENAATNSSNSIARFGTMEFQTFDTNNAWIGENIFFNGSAWARRQTGSGGLFIFNGPEGQFRFFGSGAAGSNPGGNTQFKIASDGTFAVGASVNNTVGLFDGAAFLVNASGNATFAGNLTVSGSQINFTALPTSDPGVAGRLWRDGTTVKVSV